MNETQIKDDYIIIFVRYRNKKLECLIDLDDLKKVKKYYWYARWSKSANTYYAYAQEYYPNKRFIHMHRLIMNLLDNNFVEIVPDHKDHNGLNNRKENLILKTKRENHYNLRRLPPTNQSGHRGVSFDRERKRWIAQVRIKGKNRFKRFDKKEDAILAANKMLDDLGVEVGARI